MSQRRLNRRTFTGMLAWSTAAVPLSALAGPATDAAAPAPEATPAEPARPAQGAPEQAAPEPKPPSQEDLLLELVRQTYPTGLEAEHLAEIRREIRRNVARGKILSGFPLTNADQPAAVFRAYRGPDLPRL